MARGGAGSLPRVAGMAGLSVMAMAAAVWMTVRGREMAGGAGMRQSLLAEYPGMMGAHRSAEIRVEEDEGAVLPPFASASRGERGQRASW